MITDTSKAIRFIKETLEEYLKNRVFKEVVMETMYPENNVVKGFECYFADYKRILHIEKTAVDVLG